MSAHKLEITTPSDREIAMTRVFDAPRALVFRAWTTPDLLKRWLGVHNGWSMVVCEIDLRVGGSYRYAWRGREGREMGMRGVYREIVVPERIVSTEEFDDPWYTGDAVGTLAFAERNGQTTVTNTVQYASQKARDEVLKSPMEDGIVVGYAALDAVLAQLRAAE
jgi:uncharacterized protein YndB with AHSA1/START domain